MRHYRICQMCQFHYIFWSLGFGYQSQLSHMFTSITNVNLALFFNKFTRYLKRDQARFAILFHRKRNKYDSWLWYLHTHNQKVTKICIEPGTQFPSATEKKSTSIKFLVFSHKPNQWKEQKLSKSLPVSLYILVTWFWVPKWAVPYVYFYNKCKSCTVF